MRLFAPTILLVACAWLPAARAEDSRIDIQCDQILHEVPRLLTGACLEDVNHEVYGGIYSQMVFGESFQEPAPAARRPDGRSSASPPQVSSMWRPVRRGTAQGRFALVAQNPFVGAQSQQVVFDSGEGAWGIENRGLNRWGMNFAAGKPYEGRLWTRAERPAVLVAALESGDGTQVYAEKSLALPRDKWQCIDFTLTPQRADKAGRLALLLKQPCSVTLGYVSLQPGAWGRFKGLPVRRDVAEGLINQGIKVLRYGGSMVNHPQYRWKNMVGPRDRRPPCQGFWYRYSSNGWGILDFINFCEAAGFEYVPAFNLDESPQDMADFIEYVKGAADSRWGARRAAAGHPAPYRLKYLELGNEERVDERYAAKFEKLAAAIWAKDPTIVPVVGDFEYGKPIGDPLNFDGAASRIKTLAAHRRHAALRGAAPRRGLVRRSREHGTARESQPLVGRHAFVHRRPGQDR